MADQGSRMENLEIQDLSESKTFLQLLAKEINRGVNKYNYYDLETYIFESLELLPDGKLKDALQNPSQNYVEYLWSLVNCEKKVSAEVNFNLFNKNGIDETLRSIFELKSYKDQIKYLTEMALCLPHNQVFESLLKAQRMEMPSDENEVVVLSKFIELYGRLAIKCHNLEMLNELMQTVLSEIDKVNDKMKASRNAQENWLDLKDVIHQFLIHCNMKQKTQIKKCTLNKDNATQTKEWKQFLDILAATIAIYIDVIIAIGERNEEINNHISNIVYLLLGDSPWHILDMANQIFTLESSTVKIVFPFLRKVFETTKSCSKESPNYIKFVCFARKVQQCLSDDEMDCWYLKKNVCSLLPPQNFLSWLSDIDHSLVQDLELSGLVGQEITDKILFCKDEKKIDKLLDLTSHPEKWDKIYESDEPERNEQGDVVENDSLFFVDAQGSSEILQQCEDRQEITNGRNETILKSQINNLLEKRGSIDSEDEIYDLDISFEDNDEETIDLNDSPTFQLTRPDDNPDGNHDDNPDDNPDDNHDDNPDDNHDDNSDDMKLDVIENKKDINVFVERESPAEIRKKLRKRKPQTLVTSKREISKKKKTKKRFSKTV
ncbi:uncharacterized protein LOC114538271 [Dendronephthya gigantea]|uniref:uncharacterized protein LOC114538271 n=1 Tax=Dendronephthya gigantea TaxID=151771 RepID=UPI00106CA366|nr:uncharacterized protein LOC114538271 [Dendronephthya gigantea]